MPEVNVDDRNWEQYRQCEVRRPLEEGDHYFGHLSSNAYKFDIVWIHTDIARKGNKIVDGRGKEWVIHETYGVKKMPGSRESFKQK